MGQVVRDWNELKVILEPLRRAGKTIVSTNGVFDIIHVGHIRYLQAARSLGDLLVVALNSDACTRKLKGPTRPFVNENDRMEMIAALQCVDYVTLFDDPTPEPLLNALRPAIHTKGGDYHVALLPEANIVHAYGGKVVALPFESGYSTTSLTERIAGTIKERG